MPHGGRGLRLFLYTEVARRRQKPPALAVQLDQGAGLKVGESVAYDLSLDFVKPGSQVHPVYRGVGRAPDRRKRSYPPVSFSVSPPHLYTQTST
jgi:hypothetical protein